MLQNGPWLKKEEVKIINISNVFYGNFFLYPDSMEVKF